MNPENTTLDADFAERVRVNQENLRAALKPRYDFIVCGAGAAGSVVAGRLAEDPSISVLLIEAGGSDEEPAVMLASHWPLNLGSERDWGFATEPNPHLNGRAIRLAGGKVLGGGASINLMIWAHGHRSDWDFFASEADDPNWRYDAVLKRYQRVEDWQGAHDPVHRGTGGPLFVQSALDPSPVAATMLDSARAIGIPTFASQNGAMMDGSGGCALTDQCIRDGQRISSFRAYVRPRMDRPNLTVLTHAQVLRLTFERSRATGVEVLLDGAPRRIGTNKEIVLSLGAIHTPRVLMLSGIGEESELKRLGIPVVMHAPGVGRNLQDHMALGCIWAYREPIAPRNNGAEATLYWKSEGHLAAPDLLCCQVQYPIPSPETAARGVPTHGWTMFAGPAQPRSRGRIRLRGPGPADALSIETGMLSHPDDLKAAMAAIELSREIGASPAFRSLVQGEAMPGNLDREAMEAFIRNAAVSYGHMSGTAKMGTDAASVVDGQLRVHGVDNLRIADASIMPRVTTGNTMAPCVVIGERAAELLRESHRSALA